MLQSTSFSLVSIRQLENNYRVQKMPVSEPVYQLILKIVADNRIISTNGGHQLR